MSYTELVNEPDSHIIWQKGWLNPSMATNYYKYLRDNLPWVQAYETYTFPIKNKDGTSAGEETKKVAVPRLIYYCGDEPKMHAYGSQEYKLDSWEKQVLFPVVKTANSQLGVKFDSCLVNYYRDKKDSIAWHSDKECKPPNCIVITIALFEHENESRDFQIRKAYKKGRDPPTKITTIDMKCGDAVVMFGSRVHMDWLHHVPKRTGKKHIPPRISVTFR